MNKKKTYLSTVLAKLMRYLVYLSSETWAYQQIDCQILNAIFTLWLNSVFFSLSSSSPSKAILKVPSRRKKKIINILTPCCPLPRIGGSWQSALRCTKWRCHCNLVCSIYIGFPKPKGWKYHSLDQLTVNKVTFPNTSFWLWFMVAIT